MNFLQISLLNLATATGLMSLLWIVSVIRRDASVVDPFWGFGFVVLAWLNAALVGHWDFRTWLLVLIVSVWGLRLSGYLFWRNRGKSEDRRYAAMRDKHGDRFWWISLFTVFVLQGVIMWFVSFPIQAGMYWSESGALGTLDLAGVALWSIGVFFEAVGDYQLAVFKSDPENRGRVLDRGLWRYTRHPNYFGDFCVWWGIFLVAAATGCWWTVISPMAMSFFLIKVSGVTLLEKDIHERRPGYREYILRTNAFFPGPPAKTGGAS